MLIRHISIPRNSGPITLKTHKDLQESYQLRDYSDYLTRTLNPQQPDNDVLVSFKTKTHNKTNSNLENGKKLIRRSSSVLDCETHQNISDFTNANLPKQLEIWEANQQREKQIRPNYSLPKREKLDSLKQNQQLNNNAYMQNVYNKRDYSVTPMINKPYLSQHMLMNEQEDHGLVNNHAKSSIVNGQLYRTLEKIQSRTPNNKETKDIVKVNSHKKYSYSLPKNSFAPKIIQNIEEKRLIPKKEKIQQKHSTKAINQNKNMKQLFSDNPLPERKRKVIPFQEEQSTLCQMVTFDTKNQKGKKIRKTSQEELNIPAKPESEINLSNKHIRVQPHSLMDYVDVPLQKIQISYRTSLSELKDICTMKELDKMSVIIKIPEIFSYPMFTGLQQQSKLFKKSEELLSHLKISYKKDMSIKKYNNCILIVANYIAVVWHYAGKVYLGGWKYQVLDDGHKNGLGLQWSPKKYVYYGQFANGKRHGVGIMKSSSNQLFSGIWHENKYIRPLKRSDLNSHNVYSLFQAEQVSP